MKKLILTLAAACLFAAPALAQDEAKPADSVQAQPAAEAAVDLTKQYRDDLKAARAAVKEKNTALALALNKIENYDEAEVTALHQAVKDAQNNLADAELKAIIFYKKAHPAWQPNTSGNKVSAPANLNKSPDDLKKTKKAEKKANKKAKKENKKEGQTKPAKAKKAKTSE